MTDRKSFLETSVSLPTSRRSFALFVVLLCLAAPAISVGGLGHVATEPALSSPGSADARFDGPVTTAADAESPTSTENTTTETTTSRTNGTSTGSEYTWINGTLATNAGTPVTNDTVQVWHDGTVVAETTTGATGTFAVRVVENRTYTLVYRQATAQSARTTETQTTTAAADTESTTTTDDSPKRSVATDDGVPDIAVVARVEATGERTELSETLPESQSVQVDTRPSEDALLANASIAMQVLSDEANRTTTESTNTTVNRTQMAAVRGHLDANGTAVFADYGRSVEVRSAATVAITGHTPGDQFQNTTWRETIANESTLTLHFREIDREPPVVRAEMLQDTVNVSRPVTLTARNSTDDTSIRTIRWHFGDGTTLTGDTVTRSYPSTGPKTVTVRVTDRDGKQNATELRIPVEDRIPPRPALTVNASTFTAGTPLTFNASSATDNDEIRTYRWDVTGDGTYEQNTTEPIYTHTYRQTGSKTVRVTVVDASQNAATITRNLTVQPDPPTASIQVNRSQFSIGEAVRFRAADANDSNATYEWTFSDGFSTTGRSFARSFPDSGSYTAALTVTDENDTSATTTRTIRVKNHPPVAVVQAPSTVDERGTVALDARNSSDLDQDALQYAWTQTRGPNVSLSESTAARPSFTAPNVTDPTTVAFTMTVMDEHGRTDSEEVTVEVRPVLEPPPAVFNYLPQQPRVNETVTFEAYNATDDRRKAIESYAWDFDNDGTVDARNKTVSHRFDATGPHVVTLTVVDARNRTISTTRTVSVFDAPDVELPAARNVTADTTVPLTAATPDAIATPVTYEWDAHTQNASALPPGWNATELLAQNTTADPRVTVRAPNVSHPLPVTVSLEMTDARGATVTTNTSLTIQPPSPPASTTPTTTESPTATTTALPTSTTTTPPTSAEPTATGEERRSVSKDTGGPSGGGGHGTGGRSSGSASPPPQPETTTPEPDTERPPANLTPTVSVQQGTNGRATAAVRNASPGDAVRITLPTQAEDHPNSAFESIDLVAQRASADADSGPSAFELRTRQRRTAPSDVPAPPADATFSYLEVHKDGITNAQIDTATFTFRVATDTLAERNRSPDAITLYRYHAGDWSELTTAIVEQGPDTVTFRAMTPGFSTFAIGASDTAGEESTTEEEPTDAPTAATTTPSEQTTTPAPTESSDGEQPTLPNGPQGDINPIFLLALFVAVIGAVLWGYLL